MLFTFGVLLFLGGIVAFFVVDQSLAGDDVLDVVMPGLLAWLLALMSLGLAFMMESWRFVVYALVLAGAGVVASVQEANPGWPILAAGIVVAATGLGMLVEFVNHNPKLDE